MDRRTKVQMLKFGLLACLLGTAGVLTGCDAGNLNQTVVPPPPVPTVTFSAPSPAAVAPGGTFTLTWTSTDATTCTASGSTQADGWNGSKPTSGSATLTASSTPGSYNYTLTCTGAGGSATGTAAETVTATTTGGPPVFTTPLTATPNPVAPGGTITLTWATTGATACTASGTWSGTEPTSAPSGGVSVIAPTTPGVYSYVLTCNGPGGSTSQIVPVTVTGTAPAAPVFTSTFSASPTTVPPGGTFTLTWATTGATSCTASAGSGSDGWNGSQPLASPSGGKQVVAPTTAGVYSYVLTCAGAGGSTSQAVSVTVSSGAQPAPVFSTVFTATPSTVAAGGTITLNWATTGATACQASGGDGIDGWNGNEPTSAPSGGVKVTASTTAGVYSYALTCFGPGGSAAQSASVTVTGTAVTAPVFTTHLKATPSSVTPGGTFQMTWATSGATSCTASGGDGGASWKGSEPTSAPTAGVTVTASTTPGSYAYVLTCTGAGGTTSEIVTVLVGGFDCAVPSTPTHALLAPNAAITTATGGALCLVCSVNQPANVIDSNPVNFASILTQVGLLSANESLAVINDTTIPAGGKAGFVISAPSQFLTVDLLQSVTVSTLLKGTVQEVAGNSASDPLRLDLVNLGLIGTTTPAYLSFTTTKPFDTLVLTDGVVVGVLGEVDVYHACVSN